MDCGRCGLWIECPREGDIFFDGDAILCPECGATNSISVDAEQEDVWVGHWVCKHQVSEDDPCAECDAEDAAAERGASPAKEGGSRGPA